MVKPYQIELWSECKNSRCSFCNLCIGLTDREEMFNPNRVMSPCEKKVQVKIAIDHMMKVPWKNYDSLIIKGGEVFNTYDEEYLDPFMDLISQAITIATGLKSINKVFLVTALKYKYGSSLLKATIDMIRGIDGSLLQYFTVCTSFDTRYRFWGDDKKNWYNNLGRIRDIGVGIHVTSILTEDFISKYKHKGSEINLLLRKIGSGNFDLIPAVGKGSLELNQFFPKRESYLGFIKLIAQEDPEMLERYISQHKRRASNIFFTATCEVVERSPFAYTGKVEGKKTMECGHSPDYTNYVDSDKCSICDAIEISKTLF